MFKPFFQDIIKEGLERTGQLFQVATHFHPNHLQRRMNDISSAVH